MDNNEKSWFDTVQLDPNTYLIRERLDVLAPFYGVKWINVFLLVGSEKAAIVDTGMGLVSLKAEVRQVTDLPVVVLNTHGHWDHVGGNWEFDERVAHPLEVETMAKDVPLPFVREVVDSGAEIAEQLQMEIGSEAVVRGTRPTRLIEDGDTISLGDRTLEVIEVPGNSPGHLAFLDRGERYLLTGDAGYEGTMYVQMAGGDAQAYMTSLARLADIEDIEEYQILPGHGHAPLPGSIMPELAEFIAEVCDDRVPWEPWEKDPAVRRYYRGRLGALIRPDSGSSQ